MCEFVIVSVLLVKLFSSSNLTCLELDCGKTDKLKVFIVHVFKNQKGLELGISKKSTRQLTIRFYRRYPTNLLKTI